MVGHRPAVRNGRRTAEAKCSDQLHRRKSFGSDLTTAPAAFNADKRIPLNLGGSVVETPTGMGPDATIEQWEAVDPVEGEATLPEPEPAKIGDYFYSDGNYSTELDPKKMVLGLVLAVRFSLTPLLTTFLRSSA